MMPGGHPDPDFNQGMNEAGKILNIPSQRPYF